MLKFCCPFQLIFRIQYVKLTNSPILYFPVISTTVVTISDSQHGVVWVLGIAIRVIIDPSAVRPEMYTIIINNSYIMGCPPVRENNPRALASGLSYVQVDKHGITILCHLHQCRHCTSRDISCLSWQG